MDIHNAFLQGDLLEEVYTDIPQRVANQGGIHKVCKLHKLLCGLKQAPRQWNKKLTDTLLELGFTQSYFDYSLFTKREHTALVVILVYVDNFLVISSCRNMIMKTRSDLKLKFKMKDLGELKFFLGLEFVKSRKGIVVSHRKYALVLQGI